MNGLEWYEAGAKAARDAEILDRIALLLQVVNESNSILSEAGIDLLTEYVEISGRKVR